MRENVRMERYIAFLRAINVGGHTVRMSQLRALLMAIDLANVETFIASGNVLFETRASGAAALERRIAAHLQQSLGYEVATFIRTVPEVAAIAAYRPFAAADIGDDGSSLYVAFVHAQPTTHTKEKLLATRTAIDDLHVQGREIYWLARRRLGETSLFSGAILEKTIGAPATMRNITTIRRLAARYAR
jgi:uncharacterized protein (DUF1697 family)